MHRILFLLAMCSLPACQSEQRENRPLIMQEGYQEVNGTKLYYKIIGEGEPVMVVHGGPGLDHSYLLPQMAELAKDYQLIFYDQRLSGKSPAEIDSTEITLANFIEDIEGLRQALNLGKIHLLGHSWGGHLAMRYALAHPEQLRTLILSNSMPGSSALWQKEEEALRSRFTAEDSIARAAIAQSEDFQNQRPEAFAEMLRLSFRKQFYEPALADSLHLSLPEDFLARSRKFGYLMPDISDYDLHPELPGISCPTLIIYGDHEVSAKLAAPALQQAIPESELVIIEECGHFPYIEKPEAYFSQLRAFLEEH